MAISSTSHDVLPAATGITYVGFLAQLPPDLVLGAFTGSVIFLLGVTTKPKWQWVVLFTLAFMSGVLGGPTVSHIAGEALKIISIEVAFPSGMGAMLASATTINFLGWLRDNPTFFFKKLKKEGDE